MGTNVLRGLVTKVVEPNENHRTADGTEWRRSSSMIKPRRQDEGCAISKSQSSPSSLSPIPIEWLDPDCWRLPSGKALAEFALQAGFLAPLLLGTPLSVPKSKRPAAKRAPVESAVGEPESKPVSNGIQATEGRKLARESSRASKRV